MRTVSIIGLIAVLVAALALAKNADAAPDPPVLLSWVAPNRSGCPDAAYVLGEIRRYVGATAVRQGAPIQANATVRSIGLDRWQLLLRTTDRDIEGERVFQDESCRAVADAAVVVLAWMIDPDAMANRPASPPPQNRPPPPPAPIAKVPLVAPVRAHLRPFVAVGATGDLGTLPWAALGTQARGGASWKGFRVAAHSSYWPSRRQAVQPVSSGMTAGASFALWALGLEGCIDVLQAPSVQRVEVSLCAGPEADLIHGAGFGVSVPAQANKAWLSLNAGFEARLELTFALRLVLRGASLVPSEREHFALRGVGEIYQPALIAGRVSVGVELEL